MTNRWISLRRRAVRDDRGAVMVEFAISSLLFFLIAFGTLEFGRMIMDYSIVSNAAREGVRFAAVRGNASGHTATATEVQTYVAGRSVGLLTADNVAVTWPTNKNQGSIVQVQVTYNFTPIVALLPSQTVQLRSTTEMTIVR